MSTERASSAVRNLRSLFEVKSGDNSPDTRGRSTSGLTSEKENSRPTSRIRASFVSVGPSGGMATAIENGVGAGMGELKRESSAGMRRGSFMATEDSDEGGLLELKKTVSEEVMRRETDSSVAESIPEAAVESAVGTPKIYANKSSVAEDFNDSPLAHKEDKEPANPDKPTTAAEEEPSGMKPADMADESAVSGGAALPPVTEDLRPNGHTEATTEAEATPKANGESVPAPATQSLESALKAAKRPAAKPEAKPAVNGKPSSISTRAPAKPSSTNGKSPASQPKTPLSAKASSSLKSDSPRVASLKEPTKKASRSSLTAPTAASVAKAAGSDRSISTSSKQSQKPKPSAREGTKPIDLPSRLTAPTAASRARHEPSSAAPSKSSGAFDGRASTTSRPKPQALSARPTPRSSLTHGQRPESRSSHVSRKPAAPADGSFLDRMMRPTAASSSKTHEKTEVKSPPRKSKTAAPSKPKANGHVKKPAAAKSNSRPSTAKSSGTAKSNSRPSTAKSSGTEKAVSEPISDDIPADEVEGLVEEAREIAKEFKAEPPAEPPVSHGAVEEDIKQDEGNETPIPQTNGHHADEALEATPAAIGGEETIR